MTCRCNHASRARFLGDEANKTVTFYLSCFSFRTLIAHLVLFPVVCLPRTLTGTRVLVPGPPPQRLLAGFAAVGSGRNQAPALLVCRCSTLQLFGGEDAKRRSGSKGSSWARRSRSTPSLFTGLILEPQETLEKSEKRAKILRSPGANQTFLRAEREESGDVTVPRWNRSSDVSQTAVSGSSFLGL